MVGGTVPCAICYPLVDLIYDSSTYRYGRLLKNIWVENSYITLLESLKILKSK